MKKLDLYLLLLALGVLLLIWRYETGEVVRIVAYLAVILGLYFSIALARIKRKKRRLTYHGEVLQFWPQDTFL